MWLESRMSNLTDERMEGYVVSSGDITDRVEAQLESRETSERLQELSSTTSDVLWMFDGGLVGGAVRQPAYEEVYGRPREEVEEDPEAFMEAIHPEDERRSGTRPTQWEVGSRRPGSNSRVPGQHRSVASRSCGRRSRSFWRTRSPTAIRRHPR
jgi:PAS domain-containing protein